MTPIYRSSPMAIGVKCQLFSDSSAQRAKGIRFFVCLTSKFSQTYNLCSFKDHSLNSERGLWLFLEIQIYQRSPHQ